VSLHTRPLGLAALATTGCLLLTGEGAAAALPIPLPIAFPCPGAQPDGGLPPAPARRYAGTTEEDGGPGTAAWGTEADGVSRWFRRQAVPGPEATPHPETTPPPKTAPHPECATQPAARGTAGAGGVGDRYFPQSGNTGYDAADYRVDLRYSPKTRGIDSTVTMTATATQDLSSFDLDFRGPAVRSATVDGAPAKYQRTANKLVITPPAALDEGATFTTAVHYAGRPSPIGNPDLGTYGWVASRDGAVVVSEPDGAPTWIPVNDHPSDKATYTFAVTVPKDLQVLANGVPDTPATHGPDTTYTWHERMPMASYLASIAIGRFQVRKGTVALPGGRRIPVITAVDPAFKKAAAKLYTTTVKAIAWESTLFGPYPFSTVGGIVDDPRLDYALETQERPVYGGFAPDDDFIVHELAHQWFGDSVSLRTWGDIWLNEGFATYAEWLWHERTGKDSAKKAFQRYYRQPATSPIFNPPPGRPGKDELFGFSIYIRGAMCLQALRDRVGSPTFFKILRAWAAQHRYGNATTAQFEALAQQMSHKKLAGLFDAWLNTKNKPKRW